ncbi:MULTISPECIES: NCS2 family permease [Pelosinus]|uniref:Xanthine/uracil/vitamin C permease n=1 Tax=Pelosinus fermentans B4 TaxID=1149862 RepID=I9B432_9FIRM|nr:MULTISPECIES: NCS2 family permease [Pelosinus]EIW19867.1 Xanthine/uracil/vitamin C permease [Pelosinus fermentans B4]EIW21276.1 Xanthine/uracil/vitamin C permease [Pelosinus fermentans A11]OAM95022.1 Xanthine/uracil/vitamin C permease [Pelosinus fermentans DSM 17108]SDR22117.1 putative MFS transporter, AGZA family, xanthine/uracil permease [Pelosinus fermentans]
MLERLFKLSERNTNVQTEVMAGITTFMTMAYILFVNPSILGSAGMDKNAVLLATAIGSAIVTMMMGIFVNYPIALAPGMGLNAFYAFTVVIGMGISWQVALGAVFISGIIFLILTLTQVRQLLIEGMPNSLKHAITVGIGLFITIIGLKLSGIMNIRLSLIPPTLEKIVAAKGNGSPLSFETIIELGRLADHHVLLAVFGLIFISILMARKVKGAMLFGILISTFVGIAMGIVNVPAGFVPVAIPDFSNNAFFALDIPGAISMGLTTIIFTFTFVELFDTMGTLVGTTSKAGLMKKDGKIPGIGKAMLVDATGVSLGAVLGTSTITAFVESAAGVGAGGRTGLTAVVCGILFLLALFFTPVVALIPDAATAPALIIVGSLMMESVKHIDFGDFTEAMPAFMTIIMMPFTYSIANGISFGLVLYPLLKLITGRGREVHWIVYILAVLVVVRLFFLA